MVGTVKARSDHFLILNVDLIFMVVMTVTKQLTLFDKHYSSIDVYISHQTNMILKSRF